jgi:hypothetical protein
VQLEGAIPRRTAGGKGSHLWKHLNDEVEFGDTITRNGQTVPFLVSLFLCDKARKEDVRTQMVKLLGEPGILGHDDGRWIDWEGALQQRIPDRKIIP